MAAAGLDAPRFFVVAHERRHIVPAAHERVEYGAADISGRAGEKDAHAKRNSLHHNSLVARDTLIDFFHDLARTRGEFLVYDDGFRCRSYSYEVVGRAAAGFAARLHDAGLRKGDKAVFWSENRPEWIVAFWACLLRGIIAVPIDYRASPDFLARVITIVSARLILIGQDVPPFTAPAGVAVWKLHEFDWHADAPSAAE